MKHLLKLIAFLSFNCFSQNVEKQPFYFQTKKLVETLDYIGNPISNSDKDAITE